ncbi:mitochondrial carrier domain-containing protein [Pavlovales sp. CCMP2436]|nr:mitochondrial carrier domain-containing protein [Pavlovales sp. CCMP2436]|mmetsp:Transcript_1945/g.5092  ORF Transcript_1945/g.5092 Transcript_1945/m.5092 type:complete len:329 (-) Transcript_1945:124-1110(-)
MSGHLTDGQNIAIATASAVATTLTLQPTLYLKTAAAHGLPFTLNPAVVYRGTTVNLANEVLMMGTQFLLTGIAKRAFAERAQSGEGALCDAGQPSRSTAAATVASAMGGGALAAFAACPAELVMIQQQLHGTPLLATLVAIVRGNVHNLPGHRAPVTVAGRFAPQLLFRGLGPTIMRDAGYVGGMLGVTPVVTCRLERMDLFGDDRGTSGEGVGGAAQSRAASLAASVIGGTSSALFSHPWDVLKTTMQGDLGGVRYGRTPLQAASAIVRQRGMSGLMAGWWWRTLNIVISTFIVNECFLRIPRYCGWDAPEPRGTRDESSRRVRTAS